MGEANGGAVREGFIRQRRNLIVSSLVLLFAETSELSINKLSVFGNELAITKPTTVVIALWIAYGYWLYRYYVYFHDIGGKGFRTQVLARLQFLIQRFARKKFDADSVWRRNLIEATRGKLLNNQSVAKEIDLALQNKHEWHLSLEETAPIGKTRFSKISVQTSVKLFKSINDDLQIVGADHIRFETVNLEAASLNIRAITHVLLHTRILSEYYLPFAIALAPVAYLAYRLLTTSI